MLKEVKADILPVEGEQAEQAAQTRQQGRGRHGAEAQRHPASESPSQAHVTRRSRQCAHPDMLTVAIRGPLAVKMRELTETTGTNL